MARYKHNRYMDYGAKYESRGIYEREKSTPTDKQKTFFRKLCAMCKEHDVPVELGYSVGTRAGMAMGIGDLLKVLKEAGADVYVPDVKARSVLLLEESGDGQLHVNERIELVENRDDVIDRAIVVPRRCDEK